MNSLHKANCSCTECLDDCSDVAMRAPCAASREVRASCPCGDCAKRRARKQAKAPQAAKQRLTDIRTTGVALVDHAANGRRFVLVKHASGAPGARPRVEVAVERARLTLDRIRAPAPVRKALTARIVKAAEAGELRYVLGIVLEPDVVDSQGDTYSGDEIRKTAWDYEANFRNVSLMHKQLINGAVNVVESYVAPTDMTIGATTIRAGTWMLGLKVVDPGIWAQVKSGKLGGLSMEGLANVTTLAKADTRRPFVWPADLAAAVELRTFDASAANAPRSPVTAADRWSGNGPVSPRPGPVAQPGGVSWFRAAFANAPPRPLSPADLFVANPQQPGAPTTWPADMSKSAAARAEGVSVAGRRARLEKTAKDTNDLSRAVAARVELGRGTTSASKPGLWPTDLAADAARRAGRPRG